MARLTRIKPARGNRGRGKPYRKPERLKRSGIVAPLSQADWLKATAPAGTLMPKPGLGGAPATPKPGLGPPPTTPAPAAPKPRPRGFVPDAQYQEDIGGINKEAGERLGELGAAERETKHEFGIDDPTNPFSRVEGLKRSFLAKFRGTSASLASQGQLYSGAHERALSRVRYEEEKARSELRKAYDDALNRISKGRKEVEGARQEERDAAFESWLNRQGPETEPAEAAGGPAPKAAPAAPKPSRSIVPPDNKLIQPGDLAGANPLLAIQQPRGKPRRPRKIVAPLSQEGWLKRAAPAGTKFRKPASKPKRGARKRKR